MAQPENVYCAPYTLMHKSWHSTSMSDTIVHLSKILPMFNEWLDSHWNLQVSLPYSTQSLSRNKQANLQHIDTTSPKSVQHYCIAKITKSFLLVFILQSWDPDLAKTARGWAKRCEFKHNIYLQEPGQAHPRFTPVGENLWTGSLSIFSVQGAITSWYKEVRDYTYTSNSCSRVCGHYTQVRHHTFQLCQV